MKKLRFVFSFILSVVLFILVGCSNNDAVEGDFKITLKVTCHEVVENLESDAYAISADKKDIVPEDGIVFSSEINVNDGDSAYDVLLKNLKSKKIHFEDKDGYLKGISNIYAGDCGANSGWMFFINGQLAEKGATDIVVSENDIIEFKYIVDYMSLFQ